MNMRKNRGFGDLVGHGNLPSSYIILYIDRAMVTPPSEPAVRAAIDILNMPDLSASV